MRMGVQDILNIKDWLMDGQTTEVYSNMATLSYAIEKMCEQHIAIHGNNPKTVLEVCGILDQLHKKVWDSKMDVGYPNFNRVR